MLWRLQCFADARTPSPTLQALQKGKEKDGKHTRHAHSYTSTTVQHSKRRGLLQNTNFGPTQRACSSASSIPKPSESISAYCKTLFPLFPRPPGLWLRRAARCKSAVLLVQTFRVLRTDHPLLSYQRSDRNTPNTAFLLYFLLSRHLSLPRG